MTDLSTKGPDGGLRRVMRAKLPTWQFSHIESPTTAPGAPDTEFCSPRGRSGWIEAKRTAAWAIRFRPLQLAWHAKRTRLGGRSFVAVRRLGAKFDELWLFRGSDAELLALSGLREVLPLGLWAGGRDDWDWTGVARVLEEG